MDRIGCLVKINTDDLRLGQHICKVLQKKYGQAVLEVGAEPAESAIAISLTVDSGQVSLVSVFNEIDLQAKSFGKAITKTRFTTPIPLEVLIDCATYYWKLERPAVTHVVFPSPVQPNDREEI